MCDSLPRCSLRNNKSSTSFGSCGKLACGGSVIFFMPIQVLKSDHSLTETESRAHAQCPDFPLSLNRASLPYPFRCVLYSTEKYLSAPICIPAILFAQTVCAGLLFPLQGKCHR